MTNLYFTGKRAKRFEEMKKTGNLAGLRRMKFGETIYTLRNLRRRNDPTLSQEKAADLAGISRPQWNKIENGRALPLPTSIPGIANVLKVSSPLLFVLAGYEVPEEHLFIDNRYAYQRLCEALAQCPTKTEFLTEMDLLWEELRVQLYTLLGVSPDKVVSSTGMYSKLLAEVKNQLSLEERLELAQELVGSSNYKLGEAANLDYNGFIYVIDRVLAEHRIRLWGPVFDAAFGGTSEG